MKKYQYPPLKEFSIIIIREIRKIILINHSNKVAKNDDLIFRILQIILNRIKV